VAASFIFNQRPSLLRKRNRFAAAQPSTIPAATKARIACAVDGAETPCAGTAERLYAQAAAGGAMSAQSRAIAEWALTNDSRPSSDFSPVSALSHASFAAVELPAWEEDLRAASEWLTAVEPPSRTSDGALVRLPWLQEQPGQLFSVSSARAAHPLDRLVNLGLDNATVDGHRGRTHTGVRAFQCFCRDEMRTSSSRPMATNAPLWAKLQEETLAMRFTCALIEVRGVTVRTAANYWSAVQAGMARSRAWRQNRRRP
jgi:hypothetical protein